MNGTLEQRRRWLARVNANCHDANCLCHHELYQLAPILELVEKALRLAAGELSGHKPHTHTHPEEVLDELIERAREEAPE
jgi:hypothetical protein